MRQFLAEIASVLRELYGIRKLMNARPAPKYMGKVIRIPQRRVWKAHPIVAIRIIRQIIIKQTVVPNAQAVLPIKIIAVVLVFVIMAMALLVKQIIAEKKSAPALIEFLIIINVSVIVKVSPDIPTQC